MVNNLQQKEDQDRAMQMTTKDKKIRNESSQLLMEVTSVNWEQADNTVLLEAMT